MDRLDMLCLRKSYTFIRKHLSLVVGTIILVSSFIIVTDNLHLFKNIHNSLIPRGGEYVLPQPVQTAIRGLRHLGVGEYMLTGEFASNQFMQRMAEGAWPIRIKDGGIFAVLFVKDFDNSRPCRILWEEDGVLIIEYIK